MGKDSDCLIDYYNLCFNYTFNIRLNIEAQSSKYWPIWTAGQGSNYWTGLVLAVITLAVVILAVVTLALICSCL
jgi:hypothetical protein